MSQSWYFRFGANHLDHVLRSRFTQLRSHVSVERRTWNRCRHFLSYSTYLASSAQYNSPQNVSDATHSNAAFDAAPSSTHPFQTIPGLTSFESPFGISTPGPGASAADEVVSESTQENGRDLSWGLFNLTPSDRIEGGLGSWVISGNQASYTVRKGAFGPPKPDDLIARTISGLGLAGHRQHSLLALTIEYTNLLHSKMNNNLFMDEKVALDLVEQVFTPRRMTKLELRGFQVEDVACWGWILASNNVDDAISRLYTLKEPVKRESTVAPLRNMPYFMFTLILRSTHMSATSVELLVQALRYRLTNNGTGGCDLPDIVTTMIVLNRLVRHARRVAPDHLIHIATLSERLLKAEFASNTTSPVIRQRLCYNYNRLLSFLSIPISQHPFRSIPIQQQAQFRIIRQMASMEPALLVTREGFQALAKVQLAHKKTASEIEWAQTKADSWPPWREDKLGISADVEYPGSQSRAADLLRRQGEAGYVQTSWDLSARILAGWDTDKSPTIQTRSLIPRATLTWVESLRQRVRRLDAENKAHIEATSDVWAARISATRTIREAWACFCAYDAACPDKTSQRPYYAMFLKLALGHRQPRSGIVDQVPGDGREVHPQSISAKDHVFVPVEPPTFHGLYQKSRLDGVKPAGPLLALLLDHARTTREGIELVHAGKFGENKKDVLLKAHKYDEAVISSTLKSVHPAVIASYFSMLCRTRGRHDEWYKPASHAVVEGKRYAGSLEAISTQSYVLDLLNIVYFEPHIYNRVLETTLQQMGTKKDLATLTDKWMLIYRIVDCMKRWYIKPDMATFSTVTSSVEYMMDANGDFKFELPPSDEKKSEEEPLRFNGPQLAKSLFIDSVLGVGKKGSWGRYYYKRRVKRHDSEWLPYYPDAQIVEVPSSAALHLLMRTLAKSNDVLSMVTLLRWMDRFATEINAVSNELANGHKQLRFALCVAAMAMEDYDAARDEDGKVFLTALELVNKNPTWGGWPRDEELERYLVGARVWDERQRSRERDSIFE